MEKDEKYKEIEKRRNSIFDKRQKYKETVDSYLFQQNLHKNIIDAQRLAHSDFRRSNIHQKTHTYNYIMPIVVLSSNQSGNKGYVSKIMSPYHY